MKINFEYFQIQKSVLQTVSAEEVAKKLKSFFFFYVPLFSYGP